MKVPVIAFICVTVGCVPIAAFKVIMQDLSKFVIFVRFVSFMPGKTVFKFSKA